MDRIDKYILQKHGSIRYTDMEYYSNSREALNHLSCIAFLSPSNSSIEAVKSELTKPRYGNYWLFFSNILSKSQIEEMASVDELEVVKEVQVCNSQ